MSCEFQLHAPHSAERAPLERFIQSAYQRVYGAQLSEFMPLLLELRNAGGCQAALGMRPATIMRPGAVATPLFLENYLDQPVEQVIAGRVGRPVARGDVVEIGNLAAATRGASPLLFLITAAALEAARYRWLTFTATAQVEKLVTRLQYAPLLLSDVDPARLGERVHSWGSYYETLPRVMCCPLPEALDAGRTNPVIAATLAAHAPTIAALAQQLGDYRLRGLS
ncbi:MAG: thermostable hemolysin [Spongiibacteraceae bacterium]